MMRIGSQPPSDPREGDLWIDTWSYSLFDALTQTARIVNQINAERHAELAWLKKSLEDEGAPGWLIPLVLERW